MTQFLGYDISDPVELLMHKGEIVQNSQEDNQLLGGNMNVRYGWRFVLGPILIDSPEADKMLAAVTADYNWYGYTRAREWAPFQMPGIELPAQPFRVTGPLNGRGQVPRDAPVGLLFNIGARKEVYQVSPVHTLTPLLFVDGNDAANPAMSSRNLVANVVYDKDSPPTAFQTLEEDTDYAIITITLREQR